MNESRITKPIDIAKDLLLNPAELADSQLDKIMQHLLGGNIDAGDLYFQSYYSENWVLENGKIKDGSFDISRGVGVRAISGEKTGFAYSEDVNLNTLTNAAKAAKSIARSGGQSIALNGFHRSNAPLFYPSINPLERMTQEKKIKLLASIDERTRRIDPRVSCVNASLTGAYEVILIVNHEGLLTADVRPLVRMNVSVIVEENGKRERGYSGGGIRGDYQYFYDEDRAFKFAKEAVREALINLEAINAPAGSMPVVLGPGWPGVLLHEAVGHGLEGDFNRKGTSAFSGRIGERIAAPGVTVVDDGTLPGRRGSLTVDDEGTPSECTTLIEDGILKGYMFDNLNAKLMGMKSTGNCRRESYAHIPIPRMTNTYMLAGNHHPEEIIQSVKKGIYAANFGGGQVDITSGKFTFSTNEAYLIEDGKITRPIKGATLIGNGPDILTKISMIGNDLQLDAGIGICGKDGQSVPVGVGQPTLKIDEITVGGTD